MTPLVSDLTLALDEARRFPLIFIHAGALFDPNLVVEGLLGGAASQGHTVAIVDVSQTSYAFASDTCVLTGFGELVGRADRCERLAQARSMVIEALDSGRRFIAVSEVPKLRLLGCAGSQLIIDARTVFLPRVSTNRISDEMRAMGLSEPEARFVGDMCMGLPGLARAVVKASENAGEDRPAAKRAAVVETRKALLTAIRELGTEGIVALDDLVSRDEWQLDEASMDPLVFEALRGAGLVEVVRESADVSLMAPRLRKQYAAAVREASDAWVDPPADVGPILTGLWEIERRIRRMVQQRAVQRHGGNWIDGVLCPADVKERVVSRVQADRAAHVPIERIGNPLEWMTLDEVLDWLEREADWAYPAEAPALLFRRLRIDLQPVRNRAAHFRLPHLRDADIVARWRHELRRRLDSS